MIPRFIPRVALAALAAAAAPACAFAPEGALTAEEAIRIQRDGLREAVGTAPCPSGEDGGDIVVCGRRGPDPNRLPLPVERVPGEPENLLPGELPRAQPSYNSCMFGCQQPVMVDLFRAARTGARIVRHILGKDD